MNVPTLLTTIRLLMAHPNGDDGLMPDIVRLLGEQLLPGTCICRTVFLMACPHTCSL